MQIVIGVCVVIFTAVFVVLAIEMIETLKRIRDAGESFNNLVKNINERVDDVKPAFVEFNRLSQRAFSFINGFFSVISSFFRKDE
ncbi:MAG: hypothetical protein ACP5IO_03970 [Elusimicrobiales bacterium]